MTHQAPTSPTNVEGTNPYRGIDRGLIRARGVEGVRYLRVSRARWIARGPLSSIGRLEFQMRFYTEKPSTLEELNAGILLNAPDGGVWFDTLTRAAVESPILAEYWALNSYFDNYSISGSEKLSAAEKQNVETQAVYMTGLLGYASGLDNIHYQVEFDTVDGPLSRVGSSMIITYQKNGETMTSVVGDPVIESDPVIFAIEHLKAL